MTDQLPLMKCGHQAQGRNPVTGKPGCVICFGIDEGALVVDESPPRLEGRTARCFHFGTSQYKSECNYDCERGQLCQCERPSTLDGLPFFEHRPKQEYDSFYCGCRSWN